MTQVRKTLTHDRGGDDRIDLDAGNVFAAGSKRSTNIPTASRPDDQCLGAGADQIRKSWPLVEQVEALIGVEIVPVEGRHSRGCVGINNDEVVLGSLLR